MQNADTLASVAEESRDKQSPDLVAAARSGDRGAFSRLLQAHYDFIYRVALRWSGRTSDAEDAAQDVCVKLATALKSYDGRAAFRTWLYRIVLNAVRDQQRAKTRHLRRAAALAIVAEPHAKPEQDGAIEGRDIWRAVRALPEKQRDAVLCVYAEDLSHAEAAAILGVKEGTISWYIAEAKTSLRGMLS